MPSEYYLWPENVRAWRCWRGVQTQWRVGVQGAFGLDYAGVRAWLDEARIRRGRRGIFEAIVACERATLDVWAAQREQLNQGAS